MRRSDDYPLDPRAAAALAVIDQTLAGDAVDPEHAELAELTLILAGQAPAPSPEFCSALDDRVARRFAAPSREPNGQPGRAPRARRVRRQWLWAPGAVTGLAVAIAVVVVLTSGSVNPNRTLVHDAAPFRAALPAVRRPSAASTAGSAAGGTASTASESSAAASSAGPGTTLTPYHGRKATPGALLPSPSTTFGARQSAGGGGLTAAPVPPTRGRQIVQSAQLSLSTRPDRVDYVAQQVYDVVGAQSGVVENSTVTANGGSSGYAQFQLSVPSANLQPTMTALSGLQGASVVSRTDSSQDITGQVGGAGRQLADDRALRRSLLRELSAAVTTQAVDSLKLQLGDAEAAINRDQGKLGELHNQVAMTQVSVTINAAMLPVAHPASSHGFTLGRAVHDAGRVLVVAAGGALIVLAVLLPLSLLAAVLAWAAMAVRRRRREHALDLL